MLSKQTKFIIAIAVQLIIIFTIIIFKLSVLTGGTPVLLKIEPVDPTDLLRGDYITFRYQISNVYLNDYSIKEGDTVYVRLYKSGKYWLGSYADKKSMTNGGIFIKGKVSRVQSESSYTKRVNVVYGIEEYYIPEGEGRNFSFWNRDVSAFVSIDDNGNSVLKKIYVDDKPWP